VAGRRIFGTWQAAVVKAGLNYEDVTGVRRWDRSKVIEKIQELAAEGVPLNATHVGRYYHFLHSIAVMRFPYSWRKALRAAGLDPDEYQIPRGRWDRSKAEDWVRKRFANKRSILARDVPRDIRDFVYRHLGINWPQFLQTLGIQYPGVERRSDWTKRKLIEEIRRWNAEGNRVNYQAVKLGYQALIHQARKFFGSWDRARAAAGV
jgi:hypothetical protein